MTRQDAMHILDTFLKNENLRKHCFAVEACMRLYARKYNQDEEMWGIVGLLHDFDYEIHPELEQHPADGAPILREKGVPEEVILAILAHAPHTGTARMKPIEHASFACDEVTGLIVAAALVRPNKTLAEVTAESVMKKFNEPSFAKNVDRENIRKGAEELGVSLAEHLTNCLTAMQGIHETLGL